MHVQVDRTLTTIVTGINGAGKSSFIDALTYVLFGKPFRKVRLGQLINNVNEKGLEVEVTFDIGNKNYRVIRGMKPSVFEIHVDGVMIEQPAKTADYQHILENDILRLNYKTFTQIIVLGSATFEPFMKLKLADRREVIENILDISVFSEMNVILKAGIKGLKDDIVGVRHNLEIAKERHRSKREYFKEATEDREKRIEAVASELDDISKQYTSYRMDREVHVNFIDEIKKGIGTCEGYNDDILVISADIASLEIKIAGDQSTYNSIEGNVDLIKGIQQRIDDCKKLIVKNTPDLDELKRDLISNQDKIDAFNLDDDDYNEKKSAVAILSNEIGTKRVKMAFYEHNDSCPECKQDIAVEFKEDTIKSLQEDIDNETEELKRYNDAIISYEHELEVLDILKKRNRELKEDISDSQGTIRQWQSSIDLMSADLELRETKTPEELKEMQSGIDKLKENVYLLSSRRSELKEKHAEYLVLDEKLSNINRKLDLCLQSIDVLDDRSKRLNTEMFDLKNTSACSVTQEDINNLATEIKVIDKTVSNKVHLLHYYGIVQKLLKDNGLKTKIVNKFLPVINATVNMYLDKFDFPINFEFDTNFNETIQSNFRSDFSYYSFSEGEKARIDLALLFTWRDIALKKSRNATNIIIFDEIFDGSMDSDGIENFMSILGLDDGGYNSFIISHKDEIITSRFDRNLTFNKNGHFSTLKEK